MSKKLYTLVLLLVSSIVLAGCFATNPNQNATPTPTPVEDSKDITIDDDDLIIVTPTDAVVDATEMQVTIETSSFIFTPNVIEAKPGQIITLTVDNKEGMHDFVIDELGVKTTQIDGVGTNTVSFTIPATDEVGKTYEFYCSVGQHRQMGMVGTLRIV